MKQCVEVCVCLCVVVCVCVVLFVGGAGGRSGVRRSGSEVAVSCSQVEPMEPLLLPVFVFL